MLEGSAEQKAERLIELLNKRGAFEANRENSSAPSLFDGEVESSNEREVWAVAELLEGQIRKVSFELLGKGIELARSLNARLSAFVVGVDARAHVQALAAHGASKVYVADDPRLARYGTASYTSVTVQAIKEHKPIVVLIPSTSNGRDLAPRVAARLEIGLTADCIDFDINEAGVLVQHKPAFGGNIVALIHSRTVPQIATVKPGMLRAVSANSERTADVVEVTMSGKYDRRVRVIDACRAVSIDVAEIDEAQRVVCIGMGIGSHDNLAPIEALAESIDAQIGATRRVVDQGWLPRHQQIGLTGKVIAPALYIAIGVRGALNHTIGIQQAGTIVAINNDSNAEIFHTSDLGIVEDWAEFIPVLTRKFQEMRRS